MTRKYVSVFVACILTLSMGWVSCTKKAGPSSNYTRLLGKWKKVSYSTDDNGNGLLDSWEIHKLEANISSTLEFKKDSTGLETGTNSPDLAFMWSLNGEGTLVTAYDTGDTILYKLVSVSSANLQLTTKAKFGLAGYYYDRK
jgi:hypothetical protein